MSETPSDFKAIVLDSLNRRGKAGMPRSGEVLLLGQDGDGLVIRLRIPRRYRWFDELMVRGFTKQKAIERLAIVIGGDTGQFLLTLVDRTSPAAPAGAADERLARLAGAAKLEWAGVHAPMRALFGRPWTLTLLVVVFALDIVLGLVRMRLVFAGDYSWLPIVSTQAAAIVYAAYLVVSAVTVATLWRQMVLGFALALTLAAVQLFRSVILLIPEVQSMTVDRLASYLIFALLFPAVVVICLGLLYRDRVQSSARAPEVLP